MLILQCLSFHLPKDITDDVIFERVVRALQVFGYDPSKIQFRFQDAGSWLKHKTSAVDRVLKVFPDLEKFQGFFEETLGKPKRIPILSNADRSFYRGSGASFQWFARPLPDPDSHFYADRHSQSRPVLTSRDPVDLEVLSQILKGIPKRFPLYGAKVYFDDVSPLNLSGVPISEFDPCYALPGIIVLGSEWGSPKRTRRLTLTMALPIPQSSAVPVLPSATQALLDAFGKISCRITAIQPAADDRDKIKLLCHQGRAIVEKYLKDPFASRPAADLPRNLPMFSPIRHFGVPLFERRQAGIPSIKDLLKQKFAPMGYQYKSFAFQGYYTFIKQTAKNNVLIFSADATPMGGIFRSNLTVQTLFASFRIDMQLPPHGRDYPINQHLSDVIANTAFVLQILEETFVPEIENLMGSAPDWFPRFAEG